MDYIIKLLEQEYKDIKYALELSKSNNNYIDSKKLSLLLLQIRTVISLINFFSTNTKLSSLLMKIERQNNNYG